jgi:serine/threonine-protein kinase
MIQSIGRYQVEAIIGRGGMGVVYKAFDPMLQRTVALKVISGIALDEGSARERLLREARAAGQLAHRNIVVIHDLGEDQGQPYLAMEYLTGSSLDASLQRGPLPLDRVIDLVSQLCDGLEYAHQRGLVHRDIKPANLFVTDSGDLKILDFGLVQLSTSSLTRSQTVMGTASYMAPEQVRGERVDHRVDIFATGAVLYELVTGRKAFDGDSYATTMYKILQGQPEPLTLFAPDLPQLLITAVDRALAKEPGARYARATDIRRDLDACRHAIGTRLMSPASIVPSRDVPEGKARRSFLQPSRLAAAAAVGAALIMAGVLWYWGAGLPPLASDSNPETITPPSTQVSSASTDVSSLPAVPVAQPNQTPSASAPAPGPAPARTAPDVPPAPSPSTSPAAVAVDRRPITAAAIRAEQARSAADAADAPSLAPAQYAAAVTLEAQARALGDTAPVAEVTAKFVEAEARFRAAAIEARAEARARAAAAAAPSPQNAAAPRGTAPPAADLPPPSAEDARQPLDTRVAGATPAPSDSLPRASAVNTDTLVRDVVAQYIAALEGRSLPALKRVWPALAGAQERAIQREFANATSVQVRFTDPRTSLDGETATVTGRREYRLVTQDGQQLSTVTTTTLTLRRTGDAWHIERIVHQPR